MTVQIRDGLHYLYNLDFDRAGEKFTEVTCMASNHPAGYIYLALNELGRMMIEGESTRTTAAAETYIRAANEKAFRRVLGTSDPWDQYFAGSAFLLRACWEGRRERYIEALQWLKRAIVQINTARQHTATRADARVLVGAYQYFMSQTPWCIRFFSALLIEPNDRRQGIENLEKGMREARFTETEAQLLLVTVYMWERETERAHEYIEQLLAQFPGNILLHNLRKQLLLEERRLDDALTVATNSLAQVRQTPRLQGLLPDMQYDTGVLYMYRTNYTRAGKYFTDAFHSASNKPVIRAWTALRAGTANDLLSQRETACRWYRTALEQPRATDLVKYYAREFLREPYRNGFPE
jgi:tetratricopeptide (TPR) repeat protein